jgi:oligopeptide transport system ATP-binding protein
MYLGRIVEIADKDALFAGAAPSLHAGAAGGDPAARARGAARAPVLGGDVPSPLNPPSGCHFHTRCPHAQPVCSEQTPLLETTPDGHAAACHFWREMAGAAPVCSPSPSRPGASGWSACRPPFSPPNSPSPS